MRMHTWPSMLLLLSRNCIYYASYRKKMQKRLKSYHDTYTLCPTSYAPLDDSLHTLWLISTFSCCQIVMFWNFGFSWTLIFHSGFRIPQLQSIQHLFSYIQVRHPMMIHSKYLVSTITRSRLEAVFFWNVSWRGTNMDSWIVYIVHHKKMKSSL